VLLCDLESLWRENIATKAQKHKGSQRLSSFILTYDLELRGIPMLKTLPAFETLAGLCFSRKGHKKVHFFKRAVNLYFNFRLPSSVFRLFLNF